MNTQPQPFSQSTPVILYGQYIRTPIAIDWQQQTASFDISCVNPMRLVRKFDQLAALNPDIAFNTPEAPKQPLETENISSMVGNTQSTQNAATDGAGEALDTNTSKQEQLAIMLDVTGLTNDSVEADMLKTMMNITEAQDTDRVLMTVQEARDFVATYEPPALPDAPLTVTEVTPGYPDFELTDADFHEIDVQIAASCMKKAADKRPVNGVPADQFELLLKLDVKPLKLGHDADVDGKLREMVDSDLAYIRDGYCHITMAGRETIARWWNVQRDIDKARMSLDEAYDDEDYVEGDDDHDGWIDPDAGVQDDEPILSIMTHEPPTGSPAMPVTISDLKDIAGYVPVVDLHVPVRRLDDQTKSEVIQDHQAVVRFANELQEGTEELRSLLSKANQERDALGGLLDSIQTALATALPTDQSAAYRSIKLVDQVKWLVEERRQMSQLWDFDRVSRVEAETERDQLLTKNAAILTSARQHKAALKTLQAKVRDAITSGNLDLLKDATE